MASEWMTERGFRDRIESRVSSTAGASGMERYEPAIADRIAALIAANASRYRETEALRKISEQRSEGDAMASIAVLVTEASQLAKSEGRTTVTIGDFEIAYKNKYCQVWPVC